MDYVEINRETRKRHELKNGSFSFAASTGFAVEKLLRERFVFRA